MAAALRGLRSLVLDVIAEPPPTAATDRFFNDDLGGLDHDRLKTERARLGLRLLFEDPRQGDLWPQSWLRQRLARVEELLRPAPGVRR